jgi:hypothetical protein
MVVVIKGEWLAYYNRAVQEPHREESTGGMECAVRFAPRRQETHADIFCGDEIPGE